MHYLLLPLMSFVIGIIVGLTGVGGASLITPMLVFLFHVPVAVAISSDVVAATLIKIVAGFNHLKQQTVDLQIVKWLNLGSVPGSLMGVLIFSLIRHTGTLSQEHILIRLLGLTILLVAVSALGQIALKAFVPGLKLLDPPKFELKTKLGRTLAVSVGAVLGCLVGLTSVASGSLFAIALIVFFRLCPRKLVGTDIVQAAILLFFTALGHLILGTVNWSLVLPIWLGAVPGVLVGTKFCTLVPQCALRLTIYLILVTVGWNLVHSH